MDLVPMPHSPALSLLINVLVGAVLLAWGWAILRLLNRRSILPAVSPRVVPWGANGVLGVLMIWYALNLIVPPIYFDLAGVDRSAPGGKFKVSPRDAIMLTMVVNLPLVAISAWMLARTAGASARDFGIEPRRAVREFVRGITAWPLLAPIVLSVNMAVLWLYDGLRVPHPIEDWARANPSSSTWLLIAFSAAVATPIVEEFLFRGVLLGWLDRLAIGGRQGDRPIALRRLAANVVVSLIFAAMHGPVWPSPVPIFFLSMGIGTLYQRTGSVIAPIALHATFNSVSTMLLYLTSLPSAEIR